MKTYTDESEFHFINNEREHKIKEIEAAYNESRKII